jgi:hypothetical protein
MQWTSRGAVLALLIVMTAAPAALADGGPVPALQGTAIGVPGSPARYGAFAAGHDTTLKRLGAHDVPTGAHLRIIGRYGIPGVDYNGATTGLSADGRTLVLTAIPRNGPARTSRLIVVNTPRLTIRTRITLPGWFTVDAISPDGRWLYLIHYLNQTGLRYEVRAYDLLARRMLPEPIVDPNDWDEAMTGFAITRVMGPGSRWAYTLYLRQSGVPFVHALDTVGHRAVCVDLPRLRNIDVSNGHLVLSPGGALLGVKVAGVSRALISTRTFAVVTPAVIRPASSPARTRPATHKSALRRSDDGTPWELFAALLAALGVLAVGAARRTRPGRPGAGTADTTR